jgi:hypothetical protein
VAIGVYGPELQVVMPMNGEAFESFPALDGADVAAQIGGDFLP